MTRIEVMAKVRELLDQREALNEEIGKTAAHAFPVGTSAFFYKGRGAREVQILDWGSTWHHDHSCRVRNVETDKEYRVYLYDLMQNY
jgi:hypothetical protein